MGKRNNPNGVEGVLPLGVLIEATQKVIKTSESLSSKKKENNLKK